ncbi:MAG: AbrB family transcriptional regulator [Thermoflavifilum sp.]|nr:AbrB family transcriptional regulator [Thermoflavifilum sp.]MCL6514275.1 AbrB family transcriptional regulator [Alicyclobacillus sp.]
MKMEHRRVISWGSLLLLSLGAGLVCNQLRLPAAWMLGPMVMAILFSVVPWPAAKPRLRMPRRVFAAAQTIIGVLIASMFRVSDLPVLAHHWYAVVVVGGGTLLFSLVVGRILSRIAHMDPMTAVLGALPGGASGMVAMSRELDADPKMVAVMQYIRLILVVLSAAAITKSLAPSVQAHPSPVSGDVHVAAWAFLWSLVAGVVGAVMAIRLRVPTGALLGSIALPTVISAVTGWPVHVPSLLSAAAYIVMGLYVGLMFDAESLRHAGILLPFILGSTLVLIGICAALGWVLNAVTGDGLLTSLLATSPGGLDSVTLTAMGGGANIALVVSLQTVRLFSIIFLGPLLVRWLAGRRSARSAS